MESMPLPELNFYTDEPKLIANMLKEQWSLDTKGTPLSIGYEPEQFLTNSRVGHIYVYETSHSDQVSTTDYRTIQKESRLSIRVSNRFRDVHYMWVNEVYRILMANRRAGTKLLNGYTHMDVVVDRPYNDASGWYVTTVEIKLISPHMPIMSPGFGPRINKQFAEALHHDE